jgi:uncharacterized protein
MAAKLVLVSGASSGIGEATAKLYGARGAHVVLLARDTERLGAVAKAIRQDGGTATFYPVDLGDTAETMRIAARVTDDVGIPDVLINNAGAGRWKKFLETTPEEARAMMAVPYFAAFDLTRAFAPGMIARGSGSIAFVTSPASYLAWPRASAYIAARRALTGLAETLQSEFKGTGVTVTVVALGTVETPYWQHNPGSRENLPKADPRLVPILTPKQAAEAIVAGIEQKKRLVVKPGIFRALFALNALFPRIVARELSKS